MITVGLSRDPGGGRVKIANSSRPHPRKFGVNRFLVVREVAGAVSGVACFGPPPWEKIFGGVTAIVSLRPGGWMQQSAVPMAARFGGDRALEDRLSQRMNE